MAFSSTRSMMGAASHNTVAPIHPGSSTTYTSYGTYTYTVGSGVTELTVEMWGAGGSTADTISTSSLAGLGGGGAWLKCKVPVTPGETLDIIIGGGATRTTFGQGGFGSGGSSAISSPYGGAGGGRTGILRSGVPIAIVGAGAGGGAGLEPSSGGGQGGSGGTSTGNNGSGGARITAGSIPQGGIGGNQINGGTGGTPSDGGDTAGTAGSYFAGGDGGTKAGGGGAGYYGGGGGSSLANTSGSGGAGGSSYFDVAATLSQEQEAGTLWQAGGQTSPKYVAQAGNGGRSSTSGFSTNGHDGRIVIY